ncbi:DUF1629 domain-containing protein [Myxococcus sp. SDU36]|uniref:imm11 family protein n=1 Tax=Myxococcus sp. SDU36 TaxID=2831967 RepID=UPI0025427352|nr:DUF1629 domain-containing protein [Myxococcus sp. SDU36]WIG94787.1 hypothetical protein KGD87_30415 [Myxococcus sp. SDU36]
MYYRLTNDLYSSNFAGLSSTPTTGVPWTMGVRSKAQVEEPIPCELHPESADPPPDLILTIPIFSTRLIEVLKSVGVKNMDLYQVALNHPELGKTYTDYRAVNILGRIACADLKQSQYLPDHEPPLMKFDKLVLDETKTMGVPMFRLAESTMCILVSEKVKQALETAGLRGVRLLSLDGAANTGGN